MSDVPLSNALSFLSARPPLNHVTFFTTLLALVSFSEATMLDVSCIPFGIRANELLPSQGV